METGLQIFNSPQFGEIRIIVDDNNEPRVRLKDNCEVFGLKAIHV